MRVFAIAVLALVLSPSGAMAPPPDVPAAADAPSKDFLLALWEEHHLSPHDYVLRKFSDEKWVFLGEYHRIKHDVDLVVSLIPALHEKTDVRHLAMEFLCRDRTEEANRLINAGKWDRGQAMEFFQSQFVSWSYEEYLGIFQSAWRSNRRWGKERGPFQFVGLHPCPDWETIHDGKDPEAVEREQEKHRRYDEIMAESLEVAVLEPGRKALIFTGIAHSTAKYPEYWVGTDRPLPRMGNLVYRKPYREDMFFICLHAPFYDSASGKDIYPFDGVLDRLMAGFRRDIGFDVVDTPFANLVHEPRSPGSITEFTFGELYDGYIMFKTPIKEYAGTTCIRDWITDEAGFRRFWRNLSSKEASQRISKIPVEEFLADRCAPRPDHGVEFRRRFRKLPDIGQ
jgi:hypothetical protein